MKCLVLLVFAIASVYGAAVPEFDEKELVKFDNTENERKFSYKLNDGQTREETVSIINPGTDDEYIEIKGSYSYSDGTRTYTVDYVADKNGYQAKTTIGTGHRKLGPHALGVDPNVLASLVG